MSNYIRKDPILRFVGWCAMLIYARVVQFKGNNAWLHQVD